MKITKHRLTEIIKEEIKNILEKKEDKWGGNKGDEHRSAEPLYGNLEGIEDFVPVFEEEEDLQEKKKDWMADAINPEHKGDCTPMTKKTCTPHRKAMAKRFKKAAHKKEEEGGTGWQGKV